MAKLYLSDGYNSTLVNDDNTFITVPYTVSLKTYILKEDAEIYTKDGKHFNGKKGDGVSVIAQYVPNIKKSRYFYFKLDAESLKEYNEFLKEKEAEHDLATNDSSQCMTDCEAA